MSSLTYFEAQKWAFSFGAKFKVEESTVNLLLLGIKDWNLTDLLLNYREQMPSVEFEKFKGMVEKVAQGWPPQYLLGEAVFLGRKFKVTEDTLIPRQETEELVDWILADFEDTTSQLKLVDIGTGTGIIGLSVQLARPAWNVTLTDISPAALTVAQANARRYKLIVKTICSDLFSALKGEKYDIIVSNPPYIATAEKDLMDRSVLEHEPQLALFAADKGLLMYQRIAAEIQAYLSKKAVLYLEIGFQQGQAVKAIFEKAFPAATVSLRTDMAGHDRMLRVIFNNIDREVK
ncbi:peptide chain release factor N(5)-glutamine methyltransferase [Liquorilactobacillus capillatus]|uniref:Release factor glutamine methyltransferase n=1 Tax=Liquorilactobacillus capillatus DSM 19910 TaxID=1423731 RepID=A0A0R1LWT9_9LACO|nr:peptide chain release factor N(5)-glutamine methyltransferase [Liquorilactobacillus capillatus]KRL00140.1 peptide release factor-glutamine N5-methyltransferase [Liquorilactobacillus capillatus DSM 19910]